jgi:hypothetical protein
MEITFPIPGTDTKNADGTWTGVRAYAGPYECRAELLNPVHSCTGGVAIVRHRSRVPTLSGDVELQLTGVGCTEPLVPVRMRVVPE